MKKTLKVLLILILCLTMAFSSAGAYTLTDKFNEILEVYTYYHLDDTPEPELLRDLLNALITNHPETFDTVVGELVKLYDPYSHYYSVDQLEQQTAAKTSYGIGVTLRAVDGGFELVSVEEGTPAHYVGLKAGDVIRYINGMSTRNLTVGVLSMLFNGDRWAENTIHFTRGENKYRVTLKNDTIHASTVSFETLADNVGYVRVTAFDAELNTYADFRVACQKLAAAGCTRLLVDVRDNNGGDTNEMLNMINFLVPEKDVHLISFASKGDEKETYYSTGSNTAFEKVGVLINGMSISAAECMAYALQQSGRATVIGQRSFGKGVGQYLVPLQDGSMLSVTSLRAENAHGETYHGVGVTPDLEVLNTTAPFDTSSLLPLTQSQATSLRPGDSGEAVLALQQRMVLMGYLTEAEDSFDSQLELVIKLFQRACKLEETGRLNTATYGRLNSTINYLASQEVTTDVQLEKALEWASR